MWETMLKSLIPTALAAMGYSKTQFDAGIAEARQYAEALKERIYKAEETINRLESKIDQLLTERGQK